MRVIVVFDERRRRFRWNAQKPLALGAGGFFANGTISPEKASWRSRCGWSGQSRFNNTKWSLELLDGAVPFLANTARRAVHDRGFISRSSVMSTPMEIGNRAATPTSFSGAVALAKVGSFILR
jgi:hypothetical protein